MNHPEKFDVIVVGGGHAGVEAALASARLGADTLLLTQSIETIGQMSCNPAIGGIGKSHLVREIDALGGAMALAADEAGIQFRTLNVRKGPAVRATRAQADRVLYKQAIRRKVEAQENLQVFQDTVEDLSIENDRIGGVITRLGLNIETKAVVLTTGTFLGGRIFVGEQQHSGGRAGDPASTTLAQRLRARPFRVGRLKTGTPPRIDGKTVDFRQMDEQPGDDPVPVMSFMGVSDMHPVQVPCHITHTNAATHRIIREGLDQSPMYAGLIEGVGPRYCPSIEDKVVRFAERDQHQIFVEPEGLGTAELYPNGISTSLPFAMQYAFVRTIKGFERAHITRPGYAIEYDFFDPRDLHESLETRLVSGLFFAGQINGTTGYEEAAAQGLLAGFNAARQIAGKETWCPRRHEAYMGVLVDDLTTLGASEPYRMFTSRAEYRLRLREDNADYRLTTAGWEFGLVDRDRWQVFRQRRSAVAACIDRLRATSVHRDSGLAQQLRSEFDETMAHEQTLADLMKRPTLRAEHFIQLGCFEESERAALEQAETELKYDGYIRRQDREIARATEQEEFALPQTLAFDEIQGLSNELKEKLALAQPRTLSKASRIQGMTPAALSLLAVHAKRATQSRKIA